MINTLNYSMLGTNTYIYENAGNCLIIDPSDNSQFLIKKLNTAHLIPDAIIMTHGHLDHTAGLSILSESFPECAILIHKEDAPLIGKGSYEKNIKMFELLGTYGSQYVKSSINGDLPEATRLLEEGEILFGFRLIHTPGHSAGGCCLYNQNEGLLFSGDTLFRSSIGRTDLPGCNPKTLINVIKEKLLTLPTETRVLPGHGEETTIGEEILNNPYMS